MILKYFAILFLFTLSFHALKAQSLTEKRPKIGLCLSGGAAKGIAHISLLKAIDSLGIHIDYITGTSMGAIIGGLYAIGYSGKEMEELIKNEDWDLILSNQTNLSNIHIDEKSEYGQYLVEMPFVRSRILIPSGINEGQNLMNLLHKLTFRVAHIRYFNQFPIPFKCMAADIVSGEGVVLEKGDLAMAMRASMSIPTIFTPVDWGGDSLMVDGGLVHNFPVDLVQNMGADYVIGSYMGGRLYPKNQLNSFIRLLFQSSSFQRATESREQQKLCNILFSSDDALRKANLRVSDFNKSTRIIAIGDSVIKETLPQLQALADFQKMYDAVNMNLKTPISLRETNVTVKDDISLRAERGRRGGKDTSMLKRETTFFINEIDLKGINNDKKQVALHYLKLAEKNDFTSQQIQVGIDNLYSSNLYKKVYYEIAGDTNHTQLLIHLEEKPEKTVKFGLHYDNELGSGIMLNWTARDWIGRNSRFIGAIDLAQSPQFRFHYKKRLKQSSWSYNLSQFYIRTSESLIFEQQTLENYRRQQTQINSFMSRSIRQSAEFGVGISWNLTTYKPLYNIDDKIYIRDKRPDSLSQLTNIQSSVLAANIYFKKNTFNNNFFPERGFSLFMDAKYGFLNEAFQEIKTVFSKINTVTKQEKVDTFVSPFLRATLSFKTAIPLSKTTSFTAKIHGGIMRGDKYAQSGNLAGENFLLGGIEQRRGSNYFPFAGNREGATQHTAFATAELGLQFQVINNVFIAPHSSLLVAENKVAAWSGGLSVGYRTAFIPIMLTLAKASNDNRLRPYFAIGYRF